MTPSPPSVLLTQRVVEFPGRGERGDYLDHRWCQLLVELGTRPYLAPNYLPAANALYEEVKPTLIIFTGGNNLEVDKSDFAAVESRNYVTDVAPERDAVEKHLYKLAQRDDVITLGVCRGAQLLAVEEGAVLHHNPAHAGTRHLVARLGGFDTTEGMKSAAHGGDSTQRNWRHKVLVPECGGEHPYRCGCRLPWSPWPSTFVVDSHHEWVLPRAEEFPSSLHPLLVAEDGTVEAFADSHRRSIGLMWHPEREKEASAPGRTTLRLLVDLLRARQPS